jgi:hypothetical protein
MSLDRNIGSHRAVIIGINYTMIPDNQRVIQGISSSVVRLSGCHNDAEDIRRLLIGNSPSLPLIFGR